MESCQDWFLSKCAQVKDHSMEPTLEKNAWLSSEWILISRNISLRHRDIVLVRSPTDQSLAIRRLIAMENDVIEQEAGLQIIPRGRCWLEVDNPSESDDSRTYGPVPVGLLEGLVIAVVWPFSRRRLLVETSDTQPMISTAGTRICSIYSPRES